MNISPFYLPYFSSPPLDLVILYGADAKTFNYIPVVAFDPPTIAIELEGVGSLTSAFSDSTDADGTTIKLSAVKTTGLFTWPNLATLSASDYGSYNLKFTLTDS